MATADFIVKIRDGVGRESLVSMHSELLDDADFSNGARYESMGDNILQDLEPIIDGQIVDAYWRIGLGFDFTPQVAAANCDVHEGALFSFRTEGNYKVNIRIPTFKESLLSTGTSLVNLAAGAVQDFVNTLIDGPDAVPGVGEDRFNMTDYRGDDIAAIDAAYEAFRSSKRPV
jgi:hypothetical protein